MRLRELLQARCAVAILSLGVVAGCGDDHDLGGSLVALEGGAGAPSELPGGIGLCSQGAELELIDDMENDDPSIVFSEGRSGSWFVFNNGTGIQRPSLDELPFPMAKLASPRGESHYAAWTSGEDFIGWGGGIGFELRTQSSYDGSGYAGFAFWARRGADASARLRADVHDRNTTPLGRICDGRATCDRNGPCDPALMACYDNFGVDVELDEDWQFYSFSWDELSQVGWSGNTYDAITSTAIYGIRFQSEPEKHFEFWIDDVAFVCPPR
jgi:hypothetical protein